VPDAGAPDAGVPDAGVPDAGVSDASVADASILDAPPGTPDAATGTPDAAAGTPDAVFADDAQPPMFDAAGTPGIDSGSHGTGPDAGDMGGAAPGGCCSVERGRGLDTGTWLLVALCIAIGRRRRRRSRAA
jgi:hypothetical protein